MGKVTFLLHGLFLICLASLIFGHISAGTCGALAQAPPKVVQNTGNRYQTKGCSW